ncbi:hypothetical protein M0R45_005940 [Rubus argutus]|uniref:Uncharacterized protein n=1 Tax=Rubus argutus TaxID=59490 RepID=A0AAW1YPL0_RUBAR
MLKEKEENVNLNGNGRELQQVECGDMNLNSPQSVHARVEEYVNENENSVPTDMNVEEAVHPPNIAQDEEVDQPYTIAAKSTENN